VKQVGFKSRVKERRVIDEQSGESKEGKVMGEGIVGSWETGTRMRLTKRDKELIPETR